MLKIKEYIDEVGEDGKSIYRRKVDLKELENYGFTKNMNEQYIKARNIDGKYCYTIYITPTHHYVQFKTYGDCIISGSLQDTIYDLTIAGLVEKVD